MPVPGHIVDSAVSFTLGHTDKSEDWTCRRLPASDAQVRYLRGSIPVAQGPSAPVTVSEGIHHQLIGTPDQCVIGLPGSLLVSAATAK